MNNVIFQSNNMSFSYDDSINTLKDINFKILSGESVSILGANGCGKSTLLKILSGLLFATSGSFHAFGNNMTAELMSNDSFSSQYFQKIGFIFQDSDVQLFCNSVEDELAFGLLQMDFSKTLVKQRIDEIAHLLGIQHLLNKTPFKLSGGEKKKVAIAATLLLNPQVLILDEPTNSLDPKTQYWLTELLINLHRSGKTIILTTHNLNLASKLTSRAILINEEHQIVIDDDINCIIENTDLLRQTNLIY